jgi:hypothetical protein
MIIKGCRCRGAAYSGGPADAEELKISAVFHAFSRRDSRSHVITRVIRRKRNRRHMIGDHHGRNGQESNPAGHSHGWDSRHAQGPRGDDQAQVAAVPPGSSRAREDKIARSAQDKLGVLTCRWSAAT